MIGIFDSGVGGLCAFHKLKELLPKQDLIYLADRRNSPYGTKSQDQIIYLCERNIERLTLMGADRVLTACCTASSVYHRLSPQSRAISLPIIAPAAEIAAKSGERIVVIATERTVLSHAFRSEIEKFSNAEVKEIALQKLVSMVEGGCCDGRLNEECFSVLKDVKDFCAEWSADCLILGCTHFSHLRGTLQALMPEIKIINPAEIGAIKVAELSIPSKKECGRIIYT